jgi:hypothetical protein
MKKQLIEERLQRMENNVKMLKHFNEEVKEYDEDLATMIIVRLESLEYNINKIRLFERSL